MSTHRQERCSELWNLRIQGYTFNECAEALGVSARQVYYDWGKMRPAMLDAMAEEIEATRAVCVARAEHLFTVAMRAIRKIMADDESFRKAPSSLSTAIHAALKANYDAAQYTPGVISHHHELTGKGGGPIAFVDLNGMNEDELAEEIGKQRQIIEDLIEASHIVPADYGGNGDDPGGEEDDDNGTG